MRSPGEETSGERWRDRKRLRVHGSGHIRTRPRLDVLNLTWTYRAIGLAEVVGKLRDWARSLWDRFLPGEWHEVQINHPPIFFRFSFWHVPCICPYLENTGIERDAP